MNDDEIRNLFAEMREEPVPVESLVRVRVLVDERRRGAPWKIASLVATFAALVITALVMQMRPVARKAVSAVVAAHRPAEAPPAAATESEEPVAVRPAIERRVHRPRPAPPAQSVSIRIETPDPDVVILLVGQ